MKISLLTDREIQFLISTATLVAFIRPIYFGEVEEWNQPSPNPEFCIFSNFELTSAHPLFDLGFLEVQPGRKPPFFK
jgi:hypothetical protein